MSPRSPSTRAWRPIRLQVSLAAAAALANLRQLCDTAGLTDDCREEASALLVNVRMRIDSQTSDTASAIAEVVRFERQPSTFLGIFEATSWCRCRSRPSCAWTWWRSRPRWAPRAGSS